MSCEESYLAIIRYLTDEREPYAPGTPGNTKRKIRKAAVCYVVRNGTLFYQRRLKGRDEFNELEVVLQNERKKELISQAHITHTGEHLNLQATWDTISQKYWWRGVLKTVKDLIRDCPVCQSKRGDDGPGRSLGRLRRKVHTGDEDDEEDDGSLFSEEPWPKVSSKHELVFVDSKGVVNQFLPRHSGTMLEKLNQQRCSNQFCDITLLIEGEEFRAHKAVLAACSEYFHQLFFEKGAASTHEAVVDLSGFTKASFLPLLDFAYTSSLVFNFCIMADIANLARHLLMAEVLQICESVHKQVEEQKLTVYQRGDVHTVVSETIQDLEPEEGQELQEVQEVQEVQEQQGDSAEAAPTTYVVAIDSDGSAVAVTPEQLAFVANKDFIQQPVAVVAPGDGEGAGQETVALITHSQTPGETVTLISGAEALEGEAMTVVTHSGQAGASDSLAVVSACLALEQPDAEPSGQAYVMCVDSEGAAVQTSSENVSSQDSPDNIAQTEPSPQTDTPPPQKRRRGRPAKVKKEVQEVPLPVEQVEAPEESPEPQEPSEATGRRRLRHRSIAEGGYARLHTGQEEDGEGEDGEEEDSLSPARVTAPKAVVRTGKRGRPPKRPVDAAETESTSVSELGDSAEAADGEQQASDSAVDGEHTCSECGMSFQRRYSLIMHTLKHEKARSYKCSLCSKEFQYAASLRAHLARHKQQSSQRAPRSLFEPSSEEPDANSEDRGQMTHTKREFVCDICGKTLPKLYSLRLHMLSHTGVRPHSCKICGKTFAHKHSLKMHRTLHDVSKKFECEFCHKTFVSKRSMEDHTSLHTGQSKYLCNTCGATFHRASALSKHLKKHLPRPDVRPYSCTHCDKSFYEAKDLQQHMNKHMGLKPFQCQVCGKCYSWKKDWYSHVKSHSVAEPYKCNVCGKEFFEKALFRRHVKKATHGKKGRVKQNLERVCTTCGRKFTQLREYRRHVNNHQGVKPFECLTCGVAWADARSLKRHVRTHTGERPYVCPICNQAHIDARTLRKHMAKLHTDNLPCKIMLEKDTLQFHNQGTQVEHAVSILASELPPELRPAQQQTPGEEIETVLITEETVEAVEAVQAVQAVQAVSDASVSTLSDQGIMQVVNYVLAQQALGGAKEDGPEIIQTMEVEVAHVAEVE